MATYKQIQEYLREKYGFVVKTCWIADMKEICGLPKKVASSRISLDTKVQPCPENKKAFIIDAFKYFKMID